MLLILLQVAYLTYEGKSTTLLRTAKGVLAAVMDVPTRKAVNMTGWKGGFKLPSLIGVWSLIHG